MRVFHSEFDNIHLNLYLISILSQVDDIVDLRFNFEIKKNSELTKAKKVRQEEATDNGDNDNKSIAENYEDQNTGSGNNFKSLTNNKDSTKRPKSSYEDTHRKLLYKESNKQEHTHVTNHGRKIIVSKHVNPIHRKIRKNSL